MKGQVVAYLRYCSGVYLERLKKNTKIFVSRYSNPALLKYKGRAIAEAVSRWLPTAAARVQSRVWSSGICGG
jgi:hypothetical protein